MKFSNPYIRYDAHADTFSVEVTSTVGHGSNQLRRMVAIQYFKKPDAQEIMFAARECRCILDEAA